MAEPAQQWPLVSVVLLNYRNSRDTIECLESLLRLDYPQLEIIVCDNDSQDGSVEQLCAWARGDRAASYNHPVLAGSRAPEWGETNVPYRLLPVGHVCTHREAETTRLFILPTGQNGGFAAGNNAGLRFALARPEVQYLWLLNNDTVVAPDALRLMVRKLEDDRSIGICGARLLNYEAPHAVQALGGAAYSRWCARAHMLQPERYPALIGAALTAAVERDMGYVIGASMLVPRRFVEQVGLLSEAYFLYFEEIDWVRRSQGRFRLGYCHEALVYHRLGGTTGEALDSEFAAYHLYRSQIRYVARFDLWAMPSVLVLTLWEAAKAGLNGRRRRARGIFRGVFSSSFSCLLTLRRSSASSK